MAESVNGDSGVRRTADDSSNGQQSPTGEALSEWRSSYQVENGTLSTSAPYWDTDEDEESGLKPSELFGKYKWKIEKFSEIKKRELRSSPFEAGGYKWHILIYPQGCDVCNHLSLFLCVANHDKLLPGWGHFAQFTVAVVNKDYKKSKFSDTLHRFWKKEHDWGWKKFMELPKLKDGFLDDSDSLTIDAQVQVIRERVDRPFRCLYYKYRREIVRVYFANVEQTCRNFVEERRCKLGKLIEDKSRWTSFRLFWLALDQNSRHLMSREKKDVILKEVVKRFFIEKEVASTLVMDSLYSGLKALEGQSNIKKAARVRLLDAKEMPLPLPAPIITMDKDMFVLVDDVLLLIERASQEPLIPKDAKGQTKEGNGREEGNKEANVPHERLLTEFGRRTVEIFVLSNIFSKIEVAHQEAIALKRQEELIREEEEEWLAETEQRAKKGAAEREKKSKKKQKQKRNKNKGKDKRKEEKVTDEKDPEEEEEKYSVIAEKTDDTLVDVSDISDSVDDSADILQPDLEDTDAPLPSGESSKGRDISISTPNGVGERKNESIIDDSYSTCSSDSVQSEVTNESYKGTALNLPKQTSPSKGKNQQVEVIETDNNQPSTLGTDSKSQDNYSETSNGGESDWVVVSHSHEPESSRNRTPVVKESKMAQTTVNTIDMNRPKEQSTAVLSSPRHSAKNPSLPTQTKPENKNISTAQAVPNRSITGPPSSSQVVVPLSSIIQSQTLGLRADTQKSSAPKQPSTTTTTVSRPSSAPIIPSPVVPSSSAQPTTSFPRSVSSVGRLSPNPSQPYIPQSYKHAIVGNSLGSSSSFNHHGAMPTTSSPYSQTPTSTYQSSFPYSQWTERSLNNTYILATTNNNIDIQVAQQRLMTDDFPHLDIINDLLEDDHCNAFDLQPQVFNRQYSYHGGDVGVSGELLSSNSVRSRSIGQERYSYMSGLYVDGLIRPTHWQMANMDLSMLAAMREDSTANYQHQHQHHHSYYGLDSSFSSAVNGYTEFRPSNGH